MTTHHFLEVADGHVGHNIRESNLWAGFLPILQSDLQARVDKRRAIQGCLMGSITKELIGMLTALTISMVTGKGAEIAVQGLQHRSSTELTTLHQLSWE